MTAPGRQWTRTRQARDMGRADNDWGQTATGGQRDRNKQTRTDREWASRALGGDQ